MSRFSKEETVMNETTRQPKVTVETAKPTEAAKPAEPIAVERTSLSRFDDIEREFDRLMEGFLSRSWLRPFRLDRSPFRSLEARAPKVDVVEHDDSVVIRAELPGVKKEDLDVSLTDDTVTIKATSASETKEEKGEYVRQEISRGYVSRTVSLPAVVDGAKADASFKDGVLELTVPKIASSKRVKVDIG